MIGAVIFDMDGVMVDTEGIYLQWLKDYLTGQGYSFSDRELFGIIGLSEALSRGYMENLCGKDGGRLWDEFTEVCACYPFSYSGLVLPGLIELLSYLQKEKVPVALASSSGMEDIRQMLAETRLGQYFHVIVSGEVFRESKPNPEIYLHTAKLLRQDAADCIIIEDSDYGIRAGKAAGAYVIAREEKRYGFRQDAADVVARDLYQVKDIIEEKRRGKGEHEISEDLYQ